MADRVSESVGIIDLAGDTQLIRLSKQLQVRKLLADLIAKTDATKAPSSAK